MTIDWEKASKESDEADLAHLARFLQHVDVRGKGECWTWTGNKPDGRYGHFSIGGNIKKAHRWIYELCCGEISEGLVIRHKCDNPQCVNPAHLTIGTTKDNVADREARGRGADRRGEKHPLARLTSDDVLAIRKKYSLGITQEALSKEYDVKRQQIGKIIRRQNWRHI